MVRRLPPININFQINEEIRDVEVRLTNSNGEQMGIMPRVEAQRLADEAQMDLVKISPTANPPVCKIMNYGKYRFELLKKEKETRKNQKTNEPKDLSLSAMIDPHDLETKANHCRKFFDEYDKVKLSIRMKGRQQARPQLSFDTMMDFYELVKDLCTIELKPKQEGRNVFMVLVKNKEVKK